MLHSNRFWRVPSPWSVASLLTVAIAASGCSSPVSPSADRTPGAINAPTSEVVPLQPTALPRPGSAEAAPPPTPDGGRDRGFDAIENRVWPFVEEPPTGSTIVPFEAALQIYLARLAEEWDWVISERQRLDPELNVLAKLRDRASISTEQYTRMTEIQTYLLGVDNVVMMVESESQMANAINTVMTNLRLGIWEVSYEGSGLWHVDDGAGKFREYDEVTRETRVLPPTDERSTNRPAGFSRRS